MGVLSIGGLDAASILDQASTCCISAGRPGALAYACALQQGNWKYLFIDIVHHIGKGGLGFSDMS